MSSYCYSNKSKVTIYLRWKVLHSVNDMLIVSHNTMLGFPDTFREMCGLLAHMPTNGIPGRKSNLTILYKAAFTYNISKENTQVIEFVFRFTVQGTIFLRSCWLERIWLPVVLSLPHVPRGQTCSNNLSDRIDHILPFNELFCVVNKNFWKRSTTRFFLYM